MVTRPANLGCGSLCFAIAVVAAAFAFDDAILAAGLNPFMASVEAHSPARATDGAGIGAGE